MFTLKPNARALRMMLPVAALATATAAHAALPATSAGALDPTFNAGQIVAMPQSPDTDFPEAIALLANGSVVVAGYGTNRAADTSYGFVVRFNPDGTADTGYAASFRQRLASRPGFVIESMSMAGDGRAVVGGDSVSGNPKDQDYRAWMAGLDIDGNLDPAFGNQGEKAIDCAPRTQCWVQSMTRQPDGKIMALIGAYDRPYANVTAFVDRYNPDGTIDATFGNQGRALLPDSLNGIEVEKIGLDQQGRPLVTGAVSGLPTPDEAALLRFTPAGALDPSFGAGGIVRMKIGGVQSGFQGLKTLADGRILVSGSTYDTKLTGIRYVARVARFNSDGTLDTGFGVAGIATPVGGTLSAIDLQSDGRIVAVGSGYVQNAGQPKAMVARLNSNGEVDATFGSGGILLFGDGGIGGMNSLVVGADNRVTVSGYHEPTYNSSFDSFLARLIGTETTTNVVEFYNTTLNHYFITADPNEASAIDNGAAGPGWSRTGSVWKSGGPARVCRFYGSPDVDAATGKRKGPNGHFYTISADECALVREDAGWKFESYDFSGWPKQADGSCAAGTIAVKRAYNNRFAVNDSNHRYTTSDAIYNQMMASGWSGEGTVFCAPQ